MQFISNFIISLTAHHIGTDQYGNRYFESRKRRRDGRLRRFVLYAGLPEASKVPPDWHGWLHHTEVNPPPAGGFGRRSWQKEHSPNVTGTVYAYRPRGHILSGGRRPKATGDYEAWTPE